MPKRGRSHFCLTAKSNTIVRWRSIHRVTFRGVPWWRVNPEDLRGTRDFDRSEKSRGVVANHMGLWTCFGSVRHGSKPMTAVRICPGLSYYSLHFSPRELLV